MVVQDQEKLSEPLNVVRPVGHQLHSHADIVEGLEAGQVVHHHRAEGGGEELSQLIQQWLGDYSPGVSPGASPGASLGPGASLRASPTPSSVPWQ